MLRDILKMLLRGKSYSTKILKKYLSSPIFGLNWIYLKNIKPYSINKISKNAFLNFTFEKSTLYEKKSNYEINLIKNLERNYFIDNFKYYIFALSGTTLEILKKEFDVNKLSNINHESLLIRPHPALNNYRIRDIINLINQNLNEKNIELSEELRYYPLDIISSLKNFEIIYSNSKRSSVSIYF